MNKCRVPGCGAQGKRVRGLCMSHYLVSRKPHLARGREVWKYLLPANRAPWTLCGLAVLACLPEEPMRRRVHTISTLLYGQRDEEHRELVREGLKRIRTVGWLSAKDDEYGIKVAAWQRVQEFFEDRPVPIKWNRHTRCWVDCYDEPIKSPEPAIAG